ncbi:MAG: hypothetical protein ACC661_09930, partial [Verrucomicrobiales bacterium]
ATENVGDGETFTGPLLIDEAPGALMEWGLGELHRRYGDSLVLLNLAVAPIVETGAGRARAAPDGLFEQLARKCEGNGIPVIDTGEAFAELYRREKRFPTGFANTRPGEGHYNSRGHAVIARVLGDALVRRLRGD